MKIYGDINSGNCYKVALLCALLEIEHQWVNVDILKGETQSTAYLAMNSNGKIPLLETNDGQYLAESNAILHYLAQGSALLGSSAMDKARVLQWQFFEQYSHEPFIAVARYINRYLGLPAERELEYKNLQIGGHKALSVMEAQLTRQAYLVGEAVSLADISLFAYTHVADEGGFDLATYPNILAWLARMKGLKNFKSMQEC